MHRVLCDVHTHTLYSQHAYSTIEENVRAAAEAGVELMCSTDHFSCMANPGVDFFGEADLRNYQFFLNQNIWPRVWHGVTLLRGAEADIVDLDGHLFGHGYVIKHNLSHIDYAKQLDLTDRVALKLDYLIASVHRKDFTLQATRAQNTEMYIRALQNPKVLILGHIGRSKVDFEFDPVIEAARDLHKLIEINEHSFDKEKEVVNRCRDIAVRCAELGCAISCGSDAHIATEVGKFSKTCELLESIDFPEELVACRDSSSFLSALAASGVPGPDGGPAYAQGSL